MNFNNVFIVPKLKNVFIFSRKDIVIEKKIKNINYFPLIASNMDSIGTLEMASELSKEHCLTILHKYYTLKDLKSNKIDWKYTGISCGIQPQEIDQLHLILKEISFIRIVCFDIANGYLKRFFIILKKFRKQYPHLILIAGNVCTPEGYLKLSSLGVDIVKMGISQGSVCSTKDKTGIGYPQLQMILDVQKERNKWKNYFKKKALFISDGNCKTPGDICKALVAGADFVMVGGMLSGTKESGGTEIIKDDKIYKWFYGMASKTACSKFNTVDSYKTFEGIEKLVEVTTTVNKVILDIKGSVRSCCSYLNEKNISGMTNGKFILKN